jgi:translocation protein SEC63
MDNEARRSILRSITDEQYDDIINVLSIYPYVTMEVSCEVFDDEEVHKITTGAVVTLTVHLQRENMSTVFNKEFGSNIVETEVNEDQRDDKENQEKVEKFFGVID